jgi:hypothetical protein
VGFLNPKQLDQDDQLPGSGLRVDLEAKVCPECRSTALPWQETCRDCGLPVVAPEAVPAPRFELPHLADDPGDDDPGDDPGDDDPGEVDPGADDAR